MEVLGMLQDIGQRIRLLRQKKGISLNAFAANLDISPGYLSNLETGKTDTVQLSLLEKLQDELTLLPLGNDANETEVDFRLSRIRYKLVQLQIEKPDGAEFLLSTLENGLELLMKREWTIYIMYK